MIGLNEPDLERVCNVDTNQALGNKERGISPLTGTHILT